MVTSALSWSTVNLPARSTACRPPTICAPTWCAAVPQRQRNSPNASAKSALRLAPPCASTGFCSSELTSSTAILPRSEEHTSELQSHVNLVCRLLLEKKKKNNNTSIAS